MNSNEQMNYIDNNKDKVKIIEKARQAIQTFPEKLTKNQEEIKELVSDWDNMAKENDRVEEHNKQLLAEHEKYEPIIEEAIKANNKLEGVIEEILKPRIKKEWELEKKDTQFRGCGEMWQLERKRWEMTKSTEEAQSTARQLADLLTYKWRRHGYYSNDFLKVEKQIETRLNRLEKSNNETQKSS